MKLERLRSSDVSVGMVLPYDIYDKNHTLLMSHGHVIANKEILRRNLERGMYVAVDELDCAGPTDSQSSRRTPDPQFAPSPASAFDLVRGVRSDLATLLLEPTARPQFQHAVLAIASEVQKICESDGDTAVASIILDHTARYPIRHSVNTAILTELILRHLEQDAARRLSAMAAALTMNIAMIRLQEILYHQAQPLNPEQKAAIVAHPAAGVEQLRARGVTDDLWRQAVAQHHEQLDGKGYPHGLVYAQLALEGQVITVTERYCSMVSARGYRHAMLPSTALKKLFMQSETLNPSLVELLIKEIGIYPPGSYVRLSHGELAIVRQRTTKAHQPMVRLLVDAHGERFKKIYTRDTSEPNFQIIAAVAPTEVNVERDPTGYAYCHAEA